VRVLGFAFAMALVAAASLSGQDVIGSHDLSPSGSSPVRGSVSGSCLYCHAPHSGLNGKAGVAQTPLWDQKLSSVQSYTVYSSPSMVNTANPSPQLGTDSTLCLSCHDGTVAVGSLVPYGQVPMLGNMNPQDVLGTDLSSSHPVSFVLPLQPAPDLLPSLTANPSSTADMTGAVRLINGNVECTSCHTPHVQNIDPNDPNFLVIDNSNSALCLACHTSVPTGSGMGLAVANTAARANAPAAMPRMMANHASTLANGSKSENKVNPLEGWSSSSHAIATNRVARQLISNNLLPSAKVSGSPVAVTGKYGTVGKNGCSSCHLLHNAKGGKSLLAADEDQVCLSCHNGGQNVSPVPANILSELTSPKNGHAFAQGMSAHREGEAVLLNQNRHAACVDCHNAHSSQRTTFTNPPGIRVSQGKIAGISATDGVSVVNPAVNQYENCLRCHGTSTGKQARMSYGYLPARNVAAGDPLNIVPQFNTTAASSHPVMQNRRSPFSQPSLRPNMLNLDGRTPGRSMGMRILCTDCHNSDDNREFGGNGPTGPHGSLYPHILERRYEFSQASAPGRLITNLFPNPSTSVEGGGNGGPYSLCGKCHDLNQIFANTSFSEHSRHIKDGFSCSVCHTAHGTGPQSANITGLRLVNFDINVVAPNGGAPVSYDRMSNSCNLICHNHPHQLRGPAKAR
jgi:predicted CXXCH cytochrome family protein